MSQRAGKTAEDPLIEEIPDWLYHQLQAWLYLVLEGDRGPIKVIRQGHEGASTRHIMLRLRTTKQPWLLAPRDSMFLDALDAAIRWIDAPRQPGGEDHLSNLEGLLATANSIWRVNIEGRNLERRIDPTITAAFVAARGGASAEADDHLRIAWDAAYGRHPDPDKAYDEAVLAVEALACPLVCPVNPRRSLGTVITDLRNQTGHWQLAIGDSSGQPAQPDRFIGMLEILWQGQSRHGGSPNSRHQSQAEAEHAVHLAGTIVQWLTAGALRRPAP